MKTDLAEELLGEIMEWEAAELAAYGPTLHALARHKYDEYGTFRPGEHFLESLARWLWQMKELDDRRTAMEFVLKRLVFISDAELEHAIELVYRDVLRPLVRERVAKTLELPPYLVRRLTSAPEFKRRQRQLMVLGLSDGARLDRLRRASPELSHEQFGLVPTPAVDEVKRMHKKLGAALATPQDHADPCFGHVILVDDFAGSGFTMIREEKGVWDGKLIKVRDHLENWKAAKLVEAEAEVTIVLYVGSESAEQWIADHLGRAGLPWRVRVIQRLPNVIRVTEAAMEALCRKYYDPVLNDQHKGDAPLGYRDSRLPVVLTHNAPNNSICLLWADTSERDDSTLHRHALFPRYERHAAHRP